jgi:beta-xylosidase
MKPVKANTLARRDFLRNAAACAAAAKPILTGLAGALVAGRASGAAPSAASPKADIRIVNLPCGDLGNGTYRNPVIMAGDIADLTVVRLGRDYYLMHGYYCAPGYLMWHSRDLVNWEPAKKLRPESGPGGPDLAKFGEEYRLYSGGGGGISVWHAPHPLGPWSDTTRLGGNSFDVTHLDTLDGKHYLISGGGPPDCGVLYELAPDGMSVVREQKLGYLGWPIPEEWDIEGFCLEGWNTLTKDGYYYLLVAEGGTSGPPTAHMCCAARSKSPAGPWENSPFNPIIHTASRDEGLWCQGQGTLIDTPEGEWYMLYHSYLKDGYNLGRQVCLVPIEWTPDGWFRVPKGVKSDQPIRKPKGGDAVPHGFKLSDDFRGPELDVKWGFPARSAAGLYRFVPEGLALKASGLSITEAVPMVMPVTHRAYEFTAEMTVPAGIEGGAAVFASRKAYATINLKNGHVHGQSLSAVTQAPPAFAGNRIFLRVVYRDGVVGLHFGPDGKKWTKLDTSFDVSGFSRNILGGVESVRPGLYACGDGEIVIHSFSLKGLA